MKSEELIPEGAADDPRGSQSVLETTLAEKTFWQNT